MKLIQSFPAFRLKANDLIKMSSEDTWRDRIGLIKAIKKPKNSGVNPPSMIFYIEANDTGITEPYLIQRDREFVKIM